VEWADNFLKTNKLNPEHLLIGISPFGGASWGSSAESKHWPSECFFSIAQNIAKDYKARIILFGSSQEEGDCVRFKPIIDRTNIIDACGKTSLGQLAALISRLKLLIGNDSGILHLASAFDVRTVSIFGPVDEKVYGPLGSLGHHIVVTKDLPCRPCYRDFKIPGCQTMGCLKQITEDDVLAAVARLI